jgi:hypothetical protein
MAEDHYPYDRWIADALRSVLRRILSKVEAEGLHGDHHYYITVDTRHPDLEMPEFLRAQYPKEITLVLQHQFRDLLVTRRSFEVVLNFSGESHRLRIPFDSVTAFADPSVNFGLQVTDGAAANSDNGAEARLEQRGGLAAPTDETAGRRVSTPVSFDLDDADADPLSGPNGDEVRETAEVIALDAFRNRK